MKQIKQHANDVNLDTLILANKNLINYIKEKPSMLPSAINYLDGRAKNRLLNDFCELGILEYVKYLSTNGADIHNFNEYPLYASVANGHLDIVKYLVSQGVDIHIDNEYPLWIAVYYGCLEIVKYLVSQVANIHADSENLVCVAVENGHMDVVKYLLSKGANMSHLNSCD